MDPAWYIPKWTDEEILLRAEHVKTCKWSGKINLSAKDHLDSMIKTAKRKVTADHAEQKRIYASWNSMRKDFEAEVKAQNLNIHTQLQMNKNYADAHPDFDFDIAQYKRLRGGAVLVAAHTPVHLILD